RHDYPLVGDPQAGGSWHRPGQPGPDERQLLATGAPPLTSGLLDSLPGGLAAPRCFRIEERSDSTWLWLEDVAEDPGTAWPLARYGLAAQHLGAFAGASLGNRPLDLPWLTRGMIRERVGSRRDEVTRLAEARDRRLVRCYWTDEMIDGLVRLGETSSI